MPGIKSLRKIQMGAESTAGTAVAATGLWRGHGTIEDAREVKFTEEDIGYLSGVDRSYTPKLLAKLAMEPASATFEQFPYLCAASISNVVSGSADGVGSGKIYTYTAPTTSKNTIKTYTLEGGDDQEEEEMEYSFVEDWTLEGKGGEALMMSANWLGRQVTVSTFTGAIALPSVEDIIFSLGKLYIDAVGGTIGTTQISSAFLGAKIRYKSGWVPVWTANGQKYFTFAKVTEPELTFDITFEHDADGAARKVDWRAETARKIRLQWEGSNLTTPGTTYSKKTLRLDCAAKIEKVTKLGEINGNDILTASFRSRYNSTAALFAQVVVVNEVAALP